MASDLSVAWQFLSKKTIRFLLRIKLHAWSREGLNSLHLLKYTLDQRTSGYIFLFLKQWALRK
jgi:hypothetical protein